MHNLAYLTGQYYRHHRAINSRKNTLRWHQQAHQHFFKLCNIQTVDDITRESIRHFIFLKSQEGRSAETIRSYVRSVKAFYCWLLEEDYVTNKIFEKKLHLPQADKPPLKLISREDLRKIHNILEVYPYYQNILEKLRTKLIFALYMHTGIRKTEALEIRMNCVKMPERIILLEKTKTRDCRNIILNDELVICLEEYLDYLKDHNLKPEYLFWGSDLKLPLSDGALRRIKEKIENFGRRRFKIKPFTLHMFRHSYISYGIVDSRPIPYIMNQVGHSQITTTQRYTHRPQKEMIESLSHYSVLQKQS